MLLVAMVSTGFLVEETDGDDINDDNDNDNDDDVVVVVVVAEPAGVGDRCVTLLVNNVGVGAGVGAGVGVGDGVGDGVGAGVGGAGVGARVGCFFKKTVLNLDFFLFTCKQTYDHTTDAFVAITLLVTSLKTICIVSSIKFTKSKKNKHLK